MAGRGHGSPGGDTHGKTSHLSADFDALVPYLKSLSSRPVTESAPTRFGSRKPVQSSTRGKTR